MSSRISLGLLVLVLLVATLPKTAAAAEGVSYTLTPVYEAVRWADGVGLEDTELWGGRLGYNFGRYVSLEGYYLGRNNVMTRLGATPLADLPNLTLAGDQEVDLRRYGADLVLNLGTSGVTPFLKGGGGVLRLDPALGDRQELITVTGGGGLRFGIDRFQAEVFAEDTAFRLNRFALAGPGSWPADPDADKIRHNLLFGAGVNLKLGGHGGDSASETDRAVAERFRHGLGGLSIPVEPFVGRLDFNDELHLERQDLVGVRTGFDLGRYVGLRGYWWQGVNDNFDHTRPISSYGGEARFNLNAGEGAVPYLVGGVGQLDFGSDYRNEDGLVPCDRTMLIVGGGLSFTLGDRLRINVDARDHLMSNEDLQDVSTAGDLFSSWMIGAGFTFNLFGSSPDGRRGFFAPPVEPVAEAAPEAAPAAEAPETTTAEPAPETAAVSETTEADSTGAPAAAPTEGTVERVETKELHHDYTGERTVTIPVPTEGEIYIRYGRPGAVSIESRAGEATEPEGTEAAATAPSPAPEMDTESLRALIRDELDRAGTASSGTAVTTADLEAMERRLADRIDSRIDRVSRDEAARTTVVSVDDRTVAGEPYHWKLSGFRPYMGANLDQPDQFVLGGRVNLGPWKRDSKLLFEPEFALGLGSDVTTLLLAANLTLPFRNLDSAGHWSPFVSAGLGLFNVSGGGADDTDIAINPAFGVAGRYGNWTAFTMFEGIKFFDLNRLLVGVRLGE